MSEEKGFKVLKFRIHKEQVNLAGTVAGISTFDRSVWDDVANAMKHYEETGVLKCSGDIVDIGNAPEKALSKDNALAEKGRKATLGNTKGVTMR